MAHEKWAIDFSEICWFGLVTLSYFLIFTLTSQNVLCSMSKSHILHRNIFICQWKKFDKMVDWCDSWGEHSEQSTHERRNRVPERVPIRYSSGFPGIVVTSGAKVGHLGCSEHAIVFRFAHTPSSGFPTKAFNAAQYLRNLIHS